MPPNGANTILNITENGVKKSTALYSFNWYAADRTTQLVPLVNGPAYSGLYAGTYHVKATNTASGCATDTTQFIIDNLTDSPLVWADSIANNTNCAGAENGYILLNIDSGAMATDYDFSWLEANGTDPLGYRYTLGHHQCRQHGSV